MLVRGLFGLGCSGFHGGALRAGALTTVGPSATFRSVCGGALWDLERDLLRTGRRLFLGVQGAQIVAVSE